MYTFNKTVHNILYKNAFLHSIVYDYKFLELKSNKSAFFRWIEAKKIVLLQFNSKKIKLSNKYKRLKYEKA